MPTTFRIAIAQLNFLVGDIKGNTQIILDNIQKAKKDSVDLLIFPELALSGYPPEDLLLREDFKLKIQHALKIIQEKSSDIAILLGHPDYSSKGVFNAASLIENKKIVCTYHKQYLPNYGVFDERRYFNPGNSDGLFKIKGLNIGILICEDLWFSQPSSALKEKGAQILVCINASPFDYTKAQQRLKMITDRIEETNLPLLYVHGVGGQDDLVFDGGSQAFDAKGHLIAEAGFFKETLWLVDLKVNSLIEFISQTLLSKSLINETIYKALVLGVRDYVNKNHFSGVLIGISGGIDSALVLAIAVDALGKDRVQTVFLPSRYTSQLSHDIVRILVNKLGVHNKTISIELSFSAFLTTLNFDSKHPPVGLTTENIQARCRAVLLMALSNQSGNLLLNCTNKSELAVGYGTLYGDMAGGFSVLKDVSKTRVYQLATYRNNGIFPDVLLSRPPSAELSENQKDEDTLPPYAQLDTILELYVEQDKSMDDIVEAGFAKEMVQRIINLVNKNEYKRRQLATGPRVTPRSFGRERRYPITSGFSS
ncbi:NAD+ synthase [Rickettsiella endosymbiont of Rhagonycha lignosa]|uniref:NAD+ synthase n=1 Tax=Rickettsiella endosymbiont of Rhagonycha lignosa TaxID=3077937 RepID=UPI00313EFE75